MSFKDLKIKEDYDSESDDLLNDFYIPVLAETIKYSRVVGFFTSSSLSCVAPGLKEFIRKNGKMQIVCGTNIPEEDVKAIINGEKSKENVLSDNFIKDLRQLDHIEDDGDANEIDITTKRGVEILAYMVKHNLLDIKVAVKLDEKGNPSVGNDGELHYKLGIFNDGSNWISTNGSNNATAFGLTKNWELFEVYKAWELYDQKRFLKHVDLFIKAWEGKTSNYEIFNIPEAAERELISRSPSSFEEVPFIEDYTPNSGGHLPDPVIAEDKPELFEYQETAIDKWMENNKRGIFAMATGTGKTYTALGCLDKVLDEDENLVAIITVPYLHLVSQWKESVESFRLANRFDKIITVDSSNHKGKKEFQDAVSDVDMDYLDKILVFTTHASYWRSNFKDFIESDVDWNCKFFIIADEMHGLGSYNRQKGLLPQYDYRLGLSATPTRHFDEIGTERLMEYFGGEVYSFDLGRALTETNPITNQTYLTPYIYNVYPANLSLQELNEYKAETKTIRDLCEKVKKYGKDSYKEKLEKALRRRSDIIKTADDKLDTLRNILNDLTKKGSEYTSHLLIYCNDNEQLADVLSIVGNEFGLSAKTFTSEDDANPDKGTGISDRAIILEDFDKGDYDALIAIRCLDEGVDIPSAANAILMCNSTNPREFIQRIGRVIRRYDGKTFANIYDISIKPSGIYPKFRELETRIEKKEEVRTDLISETAFEVNYHDQMR